MPWKITKDGDRFCVIKSDDGSKAGCHGTRAEATAQLRALYANEKKMKASALEINGQEITVLVAETFTERALGLSKRDHLEEDGMLFVRPVESDGSFHMSGVGFPLRLVFFDCLGRLVGQVERQPGDGPWSPAKPFKYVLELKELAPLPEETVLPLG